MSLATAAAPSPAHEVAHWILDRLGTEFWELDDVPGTATLRNHEGHTVLLDITPDGLTLTAQVNLDDDGTPLTNIREIRPTPTDPDDPVMFDLLDVIRHRLAPAYGRRNVDQAVTVLSTPLLEARHGTVRIVEDDHGRWANMTYGRGDSTRELFVTSGPTGTAPDVALLLWSLPLPQAQEIVRIALNADGDDIPVPLTATPDTLRDMIGRARTEDPPASTGHAGPQGPAVHSAPGLAVQMLHEGPEPRATVWIDQVGVETAVTMLYACTRQH